MKIVLYILATPFLIVAEIALGIASFISNERVKIDFVDDRLNSDT